MGPTGPPTLEATAPSGNVRLTLRRYSQEDTLDSPSLRLRLDLRIQPRDLYSIPSDGHCGYHSLAVLSHPYYPDPPNAMEREELRTTLLDSLSQHPVAALRAAALAGQQHPPPRFLPRAHWFRADWLGLLPALPPLGCFALLDERDSDSPNPWYYCTTSSCSPTQLEHTWSDLLRLADSGRLMLHSGDHYHPVTPPPLPQSGHPPMRCSVTATTRRHRAASPGPHQPPYPTSQRSTGSSLHRHSRTPGGCQTRPQPFGALAGGTMGGLHSENHPPGYTYP